MEKRAACEEKDILLHNIGARSQLLPQKNLLLPSPTSHGWSRDGCVPSARTGEEPEPQLRDTRGRLSPALVHA